MGFLKGRKGENHRISYSQVSSTQKSHHENRYYSKQASKRCPNNHWNIVTTLLTRIPCFSILNDR